MAVGLTLLGNREQRQHELRFQGEDIHGNLLADSVLYTTEVNLVPAEPLTIVPFGEATQRDDVPPWHGEMENALYAAANAWKNTTGSWSFYFVHDAKNRSPWDNGSSGGCVGDGNIAGEYRQGVYYNLYTPKADENYNGWYTRPWSFAGELRKLMTMLQGRRVRVTMPDGYTYRGRCWVSRLDADERGQTKVTISYDLMPPADYPNE